ncbi:flagellar type III secretion system pore protein FliP [Ferrimonas lipolytica]|uniref:Flagellar biosynthetic protein FliP n=1 Tax=Ferrimonas lipolytica TaxID=2724191 RepID=A0A6H1UF29_9GAMM|nr:flagellar type III secretion system pore protein FliP [Ferrimonas lipolytica]QIZ76816.1 flagellar type III secretion system pore protein FliP [Ferrimonas lipolytica]
MNNIKTGLALALLLIAPTALADLSLPVLNLTNGDETQQVSIKLEILALMTILSLLPAMLLMLTSFTRIIVVLAILRQAIGLAQSPPNKVLVGLALVLTLAIMRPVGKAIYTDAVVPYDAGEISLVVAIERTEKPLRDFIQPNTRRSDVEQMLRISGESVSLQDDEVPLMVLVPAFVLSELKSAFQIGFLLFLPFLVIDLIVASVLMAMGMMMLSPLVISLPFKLMVFVLVDGWSMLSATLTASYWN